KSELVIRLAGFEIEEPSTVVRPGEATDGFRSVVSEPANTAGLGLRLAGGLVQLLVAVQGDHQIVAEAGIPGRMVRLAGQLQPHVVKSGLSAHSPAPGSRESRLDQMAIPPTDTIKAAKAAITPPRTMKD